MEVVRLPGPEDRDRVVADAGGRPVKHAGSTYRDDRCELQMTDEAG